MHPTHTAGVVLIAKHTKNSTFILINEINTSSLSIFDADGCSLWRSGSKKLRNLFSDTAFIVRTCNNIVYKSL